MSITTKKKVAAQPIEKLLKNNLLLSTDPGTIKESVCRLQELRDAYIAHDAEVGKNVLRLPGLKKKNK
jgi:hypothetical protein